MKKVSKGEISMDNIRCVKIYYVIEKMTIYLATVMIAIICLKYRH